jgi:hypothetical protein
MTFGCCDGSIRLRTGKAIFPLRPRLRLSLTANGGSDIRFMTKSLQWMVTFIRTIQNCDRRTMTSL